MRLINLRTPFFIKVEDENLDRATADIRVWSGSARPANTTFELRKDIIGSINYVVFEIAELARDFVRDTFDGTYSTDIITVEVITTSFLTDNSSFTATYTYQALDGYEPFTDGMRYEDGTNTPPPNNTYLGSGIEVNSRIQVPGVEGRTGRIPIYNNNAVEYVTFDDTVTTTTIGTTNYDIVRDDVYDKRGVTTITFKNKNGVLQDLYATRLNREMLKIDNRQYMRNIVDYDNMTYNINQHSKYKYNIKAYRTFEINTGFLPQSFNEIVEDMYLSEEVWISNDDETAVPVILKNKNQTYKTHVNEKLVQYTWQFERSNRVDNTIR